MTQNTSQFACLWWWPACRKWSSWDFLAKRFTENVPSNLSVLCSCYGVLLSPTLSRFKGPKWAWMQHALKLKGKRDYWHSLIHGVCYKESHTLHFTKMRVKKVVLWFLRAQSDGISSMHWLTFRLGQHHGNCLNWPSLFFIKSVENYN